MGLTVSTRTLEEQTLKVKESIVQPTFGQPTPLVNQSIVDNFITDSLSCNPLFPHYNMLMYKIQL